MTRKFYTAKNDRIFKAVFCDEDNTFLLKVFLSRLLGKNVSSIKFLRNELMLNNSNSKSKTVDIFALVDSEYVHIEINTEKDRKYLHVRNFTYFSEIYDKKTLRGQEYNYDDDYLHIDLSYNMAYNKPLVRSYFVMDERCNKYIENFEIKEYNMDKIKRFWYDKDIKNIYKYLHLIILDLNQKEIEELLSMDLEEEDELFVKTYYERTKNLNDDDYYRSQISREEDLWRSMNTEKRIAYEDGVQEGIEQGFEQGIEQGIEKGIQDGVNQKTIEAINNMLNSGCDESLIMKYLNVDENFLNKIKQK